ncbi:MAG: metallophosphoesterase family protein [Akkermansiaceae bacterium]
MRYAIISDLHANLPAWERVLADIRMEGVEEIVSLGDVVGYGPNPSEVLRGVRAVTRNFVMGNHDAAAVGMMDYSIFNDHARQAIEWTMTALGNEAKAFLSSIPLAIEAGEILFVHAEIAEPGRFDYIDDVEMARQNFAVGNHFVSFVGHTHYPKIFESDENGVVRELPDDNHVLDPAKRYIVNVGSVGEPRNADDLRARYVIYDSETREVDFRRVEFDIVAYRSDLEATTLTLRPFFLRVYEQVVEGREVVENQGSNIVDMWVKHGSAALVDLGRVSGMVKLASPGEILQKRKRSLVSIILGAVALVALMVWGISSVGGSSSKPEGGNLAESSIPGVKVEKKAEKKTVSKESVVSVSSAVSTLDEVASEELPEVDLPNSSAPVSVQPAVAPEPNPQPKPKPVVAAPKKPIEVIWWRMNEGADGNSLVDTSGQISIPVREKGATMPAVAPDEIPLNLAKNPSAFKIGIWEEEKPANLFELISGQSFTFEAWFLCEKIRRPIFLMGTRTGEAEGGRGWHLDLRPPSRMSGEGQMSFFYDSGEKLYQALAPSVEVADLKPHHVAVVWDDNASQDAGEMRLFLDGEKVASKILPHKMLHAKQANPFRIGAEGNPERLALDELRFSRRALAPHEFLLRQSVGGVTFKGKDAGARDSWSGASNWEGGILPGKKDNVVIGKGLIAQVEKTAPARYTGVLVLQEKSKLILWDPHGLDALPKAPAVLLLHDDTELILRAKENAVIGPIEVMERAVIWGGISTSGHRTIRRLEGPITGPGRLILEGVNGNIFELKGSNTFNGGLDVRSKQNQTFVIRAKSEGALGKGYVRIRAHCSLVIEKGLKDVISDGGKLMLEGTTASGMEKLVIDSEEKVAEFFVDGEDQGVGVFTSRTHPSLGGSGKLIVEPVE